MSTEPPPQWEAYIREHGWGKSQALRCREWETRMVSDHRSRPFKYRPLAVRCSLWHGHDGAHTWHEREFGTEAKNR